MNNRTLIERIREEFAKVGTEQITGNAAVMIIDDVVKELEIPENIKGAMAYISHCERDMGFMGSPAYFEKKMLVEDYFKNKNK